MKRNYLIKKKLNNVTFASSGTASNIYNQDIDKNIYALNTHIGNGSNETILNIKDDLTFGGNLDLRSNSTLNISDYDVIVNDCFNLLKESNTYGYSFFKKMNDNGKTVVMVTHEPDIAEQTKRILTMRDGKLVSDEWRADHV